MALKRSREAKLDWLEKLDQWITEKAPTEKLYDAFSIRLSRLDEVWKELLEIETQMEISYPEEDLRAEAYEDNFFEIKAKLLSLMRIHRPTDLNPPTQSADTTIVPILNQIFNQQQTFMEGLNDTANRTITHSSDHSLKLPKVSIEPFDGQYRNWPSFHDSFISSIHDNTAVSNVIKLKLLKRLLSDNPLSLIKNMMDTDANYQEAWNKLNSRYNKKKLILTSYISAFLDQSPATSGRLSDIRSLNDRSDELIIGIRTMGSNAEYRDAWLIQILLRKLDTETRQEWSKETVDKDFPSFEDFQKFLNKRCDCLENGAVDQDRKVTRSRQEDHLKRPMVRAMHSTSAPACPYCQKLGHQLPRCIKFKFLNPSARLAIVNKLCVCQNCLKLNHAASSCPESWSCRQCQQRHHTLIHVNKSTEQIKHHPQSTFSGLTNSKVSQITDHNSQSNTNQTQNLPDPQSVHNFKIHVAKSVKSNITSSRPRFSLLPTALVHVYSHSGSRHYAHALLDSGSQCSFISESLVQRLGLTRSYSSLSVSGLGNGNSATTRGLVRAEISSRFSMENRLSIDAFILSSITTLDPAKTSAVPVMDHMKSFELADPNYDTPKEIDLLLGTDVFFDIIKSDKIKFEGRTYAQSTIFGWVILAPPHQDLSIIKSMTTIINDEDLLKILQRFWEIEEPPSVSLLTPSEEKCESHYQSFTQRNADGRYVVRLPFKSPKPTLGHSRSAAIRRLCSMERRFERNSDIKLEYQRFMDEYLRLQHMEIVPPTELIKRNSDTYYLPHHAVLKPESVSTKLRVVFDGSCASSSGISLNDMLLVGPTIQHDLVTILTRFRIHKIVFSGDIEKMYRQVVVHPIDTDFQRIVWRNSPADKIVDYRLKTVTYGTSSAAFLAIRTLQQIADDNESKHPNISAIIKRDFYVDDLLSGSESHEQAISTIIELTEVLSQAGFQLRKWKSNSVEVLNKIPNQLKDPSLMEINDNTTSIKTLGLRWNPLRDVFSFSINIDQISPQTTKRKLLSDISKIFDPLGWVSPVTITMKLIFQRLWASKISWDDILPTEVNDPWSKIRQTLHHLEEIELPRHLYITPDITSIQLHGFCDASESAYAAVVYVRVVDSAGKVSVNLVIAKTKVAPIKQISLPRLELCGSLLVAKLLQFVSKTLGHSHQIFAWTDSEVVLAWLSDIPRRWKTFIANRTSDILSRVARSCWNYVPSKENPSDCASRGVAPVDLPRHALWWSGPDWLSFNESNWPSFTPKICNVPEMRPQTVISIPSNVRTEKNWDVNWYLNQHSKFSTIKRILSYILKLGSPNHKGKCVSELISIAEKFIVRDVQRNAFHDEIKLLLAGKPIDRHSKLMSLAPFIDHEGLLRVGGRLSNAPFSYDIKHPMILPKQHRLTYLLIHESHHQNLHPGPSLQISLLKQKFWIISGRDVVRKFINQCKTCFRQKANITKQLMGSLPAKRITPARPFLITGVDYAGPILIKSRHGRGRTPVTKGYICLFVCLSSKAVHLELVSDMTTAAYIAALRRFCGRRGVPAELVSDNGTNLKGAKSELQELHELFRTTYNRALILDFLSQNEIKFTFNPASAPHFGGLWEANVKSMKHHLKRATVNTMLTFEEMSTLLCQIEGLLNSRPICAMSSDPEDLSVLTPGHFLIGEAITAIPEPRLDEVAENVLSRWQNIQKRVQGFWQRWSLEYLHTLQQRPKWQKPEENLKIDDLVLIKDDNIPPSKWLLGRIVMVHPGLDDLIRVVTVKTKSGELKRPVVKLSKLPYTNPQLYDTDAADLLNK